MATMRIYSTGYSPRLYTVLRGWVYVSMHAEVYNYNFSALTLQMSDQPYLTCYSNNNTTFLKTLVYTMVCSGPTWLVNL